MRAHLTVPPRTNMHTARQLMEKAERGCLISNSLAVRPVLKYAIEIGLEGQLEADQFPGNVSAEYARANGGKPAWSFASGCSIRSFPQNRSIRSNTHAKSRES